MSEPKTQRKREYRPLIGGFRVERIVQRYEFPDDPGYDYITDVDAAKLEAALEAAKRLRGGIGIAPDCIHINDIVATKNDLRAFDAAVKELEGGGE